MPVYEYACLSCKKKFSLTLPLAAYDPKSVRCPHCKSENVERRWSSVHVETSKKS
jgi:putative FmdB family regulatory protein